MNQDDEDWSWRQQEELDQQEQEALQDRNNEEVSRDEH